MKSCYHLEISFIKDSIHEYCYVENWLALVLKHNSGFYISLSSKKSIVQHNRKHLHRINDLFQAQMGPCKPVCKVSL